MKKTWNSSPHPISDIRDWKNNGRLEIKPDYQRLEVWSEAAKIMLMDTILRRIPMPKVFVSSAIKDGQVHRTVIDGQQRTSSILQFLEDRFVLDHPYDGEHKGLKFSELPEEVRNEFLQYSIDFNEAIGFSDEELRETYSRLNKYSVALNKQELRRADFPGHFLTLAEQLAANDLLDGWRIFSVANRRRLADVEYVSELLAALIGGAQEKRDNLDSFYLDYTFWDAGNQAHVRSRFLSALTDLAQIFPPERPLGATRFKQKSDFYSLLLAVDELRSEGGSIDGAPLEDLRMDLRLLDMLIEPESLARDCRDYAIKCVSQANTLASRKWRMEFLKAFLAGTYHRLPPEGDAATLFYRLATGAHGPYGEPTVNRCGHCNKDMDRLEEEILGWRRESAVFQVNNSCRLHAGCLDPRAWHVLRKPDMNHALTFGKTERQEPLI